MGGDRVRAALRRRRVVRSILAMLAVALVLPAASSATTSADRLTHCRAAVTDRDLVQFVDTDSVLQECVPLAEAWLAQRNHGERLDDAYVLLGAAYALNHATNDGQLQMQGRSWRFLLPGDRVAIHLLEGAVASGHGTDDVYQQLRYFVEHANHNY